MNRHATALLLALSLARCVSNSGEPVECPSGQQLVCRATDDCRCGPPCRLGTTCPRTVPGNPVCADVNDPSGMGVCVDLSWATGAPAGMIRCGDALCPASASCVDWGAAGVRCGAPCTGNDGCPSGCCSVVSDRDSRRTFNVCAPDTSFRCMAGMPTGSRCNPACDGSSACVLAGATPRCARSCSDDNECMGTCCAALTGGGTACAPSVNACGGALTPVCSNLDACVTVVYAARGDHCGDSLDSIEARVRNDCTTAADVQICFERRDGTCTCGMHRNVAPGTEATPPFWACDLTGRFRISARVAGDAPGCHPGTCT